MITSSLDASLDLCGDTEPLLAWLATLPAAQEQALIDHVAAAQQAFNHGNRALWERALATLAEQPLPNQWTIDSANIVALSAENAVSIDDAAIESALMQLKPWRKGPWQYHHTRIDTEWRSDLKWQRIAEQLDLQDKTVLDVGCGSGYHLFRMHEAGANTVIGIDPTWLFVYQFAVFKRCLPTLPLWLLPLPMEQMPLTDAFDTVFSMGVLYHRRDPIGHLQELKNALKKGGELILETLVVEGSSQTALIPTDRYAAMPNVWFIPSVDMLTIWLEKLKFSDIQVLDVTPTTSEEQRKTAWSSGASLADFLDADNPELTREGYPAPLRATLRAVK